MPMFNFSNPALRTLGATVAAAYGFQAACAAVAVPLQTEIFYDLSGSLGFLSCTALSLYYPALRARFAGSQAPLPSILSFHPRQLVMSGLTVLWAGRLGTFLFQRILKSGSDSRFDKIKTDPVKFTGAWMAQATWITLTALPVFMVNAIPAHLQPALGIRDFIGLGLWVGSFLFESIADRQKTAWRAAKEKKEHDEKFIRTGLWSISRHPNYVGEVTMWASQYLIATSALPYVPGLYPSYFVYLAAVSPIFEYLLITKVSGVPMLEKSGDKKYGDTQEWKDYKKNVPVFWPKLF